MIPYNCIYLYYKSLENWETLYDIVRCNPSFYDQPRYDCIIINTQPTTYARLQFVFRCFNDNNIGQDIIFVQFLKSSNWKPKTLWKNCQVFEERGYGFVLLKYVVRACHMVPTFGSKGQTYYLNDLVDKDMFLRCGN